MATNLQDNPENYIEPKNSNEGLPYKQDLRVSIVVSKFNSTITKQLLMGALDTLESNGYNRDLIAIYWVPGAFELPVMAQHIAENTDTDTIICLGCVIKGGTPHFDYVCNEAARGTQKASLVTGIPIIFGVLTTNNEKEAFDRCSGSNNKGIDAANAALEMATLMTKV